MSDLVITALVILGTGVLVAAIFYLVGAKKKEREKKLTEYCRDHGYTFSKVKEPSKREYLVKGETFSFSSTMSLHHYDSGSESDSWAKETIWSAAAGDSSRPTYALGTVPAGNWAALPDLLKRAAIDRLGHETGLRLEASNVKPLEVAGGATSFVIFEKESGEGKAVLKRIGPLLKEWPAKYTLFIHSSPDKLQIKLADCFVEDVALLDKTLRLGKAAAGMG